LGRRHGTKIVDKKKISKQFSDYPKLKNKVAKSSRSLILQLLRLQVWCLSTPIGKDLVPNQNLGPHQLWEKNPKQNVEFFV
jgi:hypothetical protein